MVDLNIGVLKDSQTKIDGRNHDHTNLLDSIKKDGILYPIIVSPSMEIVDGQKRVNVCRKMGFTHIPVIISDKEVDVDDMYSFLIQSYKTVSESGSIYFDFDSIYKISGLSSEIATEMYRNWNELELFAKVYELLEKDRNPLSENSEKVLEEISASLYGESDKESDIACGKHSRYGFKGGCNDKYFTKHEKMFKKMFPYLEPQVSFGTGDNGYKTYLCKRYIADFVDHRNNCVIEIDGECHKTRSKYLKDRLRTYFFNDIGYNVVRFSNKGVETLFRRYTLIFIRNTNKLNFSEE